MNLRRGVASMAFAYGGSPVGVDDPEVRDDPTVNELISAEEFFDPYTGQPRMTGVPVDIWPAAADRPATSPKTAALPSAVPL